jgi:Tfp pilus tip-associated adhesin PilY1
MAMKNRRIRFGALFAGMLALAGTARANDRDLLYEKKAYPPNILILVANTESMATCIPGASLPNGQTCPSLSTGLGSNLAPFGIGDSPYSKMGQAKSAILSIIEANSTAFYFGLSSESYTRQTVRTGTAKRYTFVARQASFCDGSSGGSYWACQAAGTAIDFGPTLGTPTTSTYGGVSYEVIPIGGVTTGSYSMTGNVGAESWVQSYGGDANHQPYLVNDSFHGMIITNPTGVAASGNPGTASKQEMWITYGSTNSSTGDPYRIHQCSADCTLSDSGFDGQKITVTKKIVECGGSTGQVTAVNLTTGGSGYTSAPTVGFTGGGGSGATATATISQGVSGITITSGGTGYTSAPSVTFSGGGGSGAAATANFGGAGPITAVTLTGAGTGYTSVPTVSFSGGGSGAVATAALGVVSYTVVNQGAKYTSTPSCTVSAPPVGITATCTTTISTSGGNKKVTAVNVVLKGSGYTGVPTVTIGAPPPGGTQATATAVLGVVSVTLNNGGSGYTSPGVTFSGGHGATATATATGTSVTSITITNAGTGYTSAPTVGFSGGGGSGAAATSAISGTVTGVTLTNGGTGYTSNPTVTFTGGGGSGAAATATASFGVSGSYPCDPTTATLKATQSVDYVVPPLTGTNSSIANLLTYCSEDSSSCTYPMVYSSFDHSTNAATGEEMGWLYYNDLDVSGNQSGWIVHSRNNPQPLVMIPHAYTPWKAYTGSTPLSGTVNYTQNSNPCIQRSFRPLSAIIDNSSSHTQNDAYPIFTPASGQTDGSTNLSGTECDKMVDGDYQAGNFPNGGTNEISPIVFPAGHNGSGLDLVKMLTDTYFYFNGGNSACSAAGGGVDGFCAGTRPDDPYKSCRLSAVILITDSFTGSSPDFKFGNGSDPTAQLKAIGVPVFVIGFAMAPGSNGTCSGTLPDGTTGLNNGQCIAYYSGATTFQGSSVTREGYFNVTTAANLGTALQAVLNTLNTATRDFATATIPSVSATSAGIAYLSQFNPKNNRSIWEGHLRSYFLDPTSGLVQASGSGLPDPTKFTFWTGTTPATGSLIWDAGGSGGDTPGIYGNLDAERNVDPTLLLTSSPGPGGSWSATNDQATGVVGRNVFFGLKPGDPGCTSTTYECLTQVPVGSGGNSPTPTNTSEPSSGWTVPSPPSTLPSWWTNVQGTSYVNVPTTPLEGSGNKSQALQNSFSFVRGNRDPVVEAFKLATNKFDTTHTTCASLSADTDSPCYNGDVLGDLFHSNPSIVSAPANFRYYFSQDPGAAVTGMYGDRGASYQAFQADHAHRRKILYVGGDDAAMHAFDIGVYGGDQTTFDPGTGAICPLCTKYDFGSGREIFAYVPRAGLNKLYNLAHTITYNWTVDGPPTIDDVYIDPTRVSGSAQGVAPSGSTADADVTGASPTSTSHSWRTVLVGTEREGGLTGTPDGGGITSGVSGNGGSVFALDVTDPDQSDHMKIGDSGGHTGVPECVVSDFNPASDSVPSNCTAPFPRILWEIRDDQSSTTTPPVPTELSTAAAATTQDLGMTWSQPIVGKVKLTISGQARDFFVAIFGGGYDHTAASLAATNASGNTGNFLYMVDIETGKIIYKKNLGVWSSGASGTSTAGNLTAGVPGSPAVIDINNDGYLDDVYIGDTQGRLWKVDLTASAAIDTTTKRVQSSDWNPVLFFDEYLNSTVQGTNPRQPIFDRPAAFFVGNSSTGQPRIGISFGTGDRDNMPVLTDTNPNFFIVAVDPPTRAQAVTNDHPLTLADLTQASLTANNCTTTTCLNANGYYLTLPVGSSASQIVNTDPLVFNQQIFFNTFLHTTVTGNCNEIGTPFVYILNYATGESAQTDANGNIVPNTTGPTGAEVLATDIVYAAGGGVNALVTGKTDEGQTVNVTSAADNTTVPKIEGGLPLTVKIKSWKEE